MIYIFSITIIYTFIKQKDNLLKEKRNLVLYLILSILGLSLGVIYIINPYLPSLSALMEKYMK
jgi:multisubunit Na+/H+ antiporter MnhB subunit